MTSSATTGATAATAADLEAMRALLVALLAGAAPPPAPPAELVRRHHLGPLAYAAGLAAFKDEYAASAIGAARRARLLAEVGEALAAADVTAAPIKGAALIGADAIYPDPALRPMHDVDLLVRAGHLPRAIRALRDRGFVRVGATRKLSDLYHAIAFERGGQLVELHRNIVQAYRTALDLDAMWSRATRAAGAPLVRLDEIDQLLLVLLHIARHELAVPALAFVDVHRLLSRVGPAGVAALEDRAARYRVRRPIAAARAMAAALAAGARGAPPGPPPRAMWPTTEELLADLRPRRARQIARKLLLTDGPREAVGLGVAWLGALAVARWHERRGPGRPGV